MLPSRARALVAVAGAATLVASAMLPAQAGSSGRQGDERGAQSSRLVTVTDDLTGPRGLAVVNKRKVLVGQVDGTVSRVVRQLGHPARVIDFAHVPESFIAPAVARGRHHTVWILTAGGEPGSGAATLYRWRPHHGTPKRFADIAAYQTTNPDPFNVEGDPTESNPFGVVALKRGALVADAAGNDLLKVNRHGKVTTVARIKPRTVTVPTGLPPTDPDGNPLPPAGTPMAAEGVATSVTIGSDGFWYVGELRGFPATPGTSEIWRIKPGSRNAVCDPEHPRRGPCKRFVNGLTSIVDLGPAPNSRIYALELSKKSWFQMELGLPGSEIGGLFKVRQNHVIREIAKNKLTMPGGVDRRRDALFVTGPVFGPGKLFQIR